MKTYELTYIVSPEITSEEATAKAKEIESAVAGKEGTILKQSSPVAKTLSYQIKKHASGFFGSLEFQIEPEKLTEIEEMVANDGKIVRHMVIIRNAQKPMKERRARIKPEPIVEPAPKTEVESVKKDKVELKDIEQQLDELLS